MAELLGARQRYLSPPPPVPIISDADAAAQLVALAATAFLPPLLPPPSPAGDTAAEVDTTPATAAATAAAAAAAATIQMPTSIPAARRVSAVARDIVDEVLQMAAPHAAPSYIDAFTAWCLSAMPPPPEPAADAGGWTIAKQQCQWTHRAAAVVFITLNWACDSSKLGGYSGAGAAGVGALLHHTSAAAPAAAATVLRWLAYKHTAEAAPAARCKKLVAAMAEATTSAVAKGWAEVSAASVAEEAPPPAIVTTTTVSGHKRRLPHAAEPPLVPPARLTVDAVLPALCVAVGCAVVLGTARPVAAALPPLLADNSQLVAALVTCPGTHPACKAHACPLCALRLVDPAVLAPPPPRRHATRVAAPDAPPPPFDLDRVPDTVFDTIIEFLTGPSLLSAMRCNATNAAHDARAGSAVIPALTALAPLAATCCTWRSIVTTWPGWVTRYADAFPRAAADSTPVPRAGAYTICLCPPACPPHGYEAVRARVAALRQVARENTALAARAALLTSYSRHRGALLPAVARKVVCPVCTCNAVLGFADLRSHMRSHRSPPPPPTGAKPARSRRKRAAADVEPVDV